MHNFQNIGSLDHLSIFHEIAATYYTIFKSKTKTHFSTSLSKVNSAEREYLAVCYLGLSLIMGHRLRTRLITTQKRPWNLISFEITHPRNVKVKLITQLFTPWVEFFEGNYVLTNDASNYKNCNSWSDYKTIYQTAAALIWV